MKLASWNVRTMCPGLTAEIGEINDCRKTAIISGELKRLNIDIAALQETRLADSGQIREQDYTFFWKGRAAEETRIHGVGFAVKNTLIQSVTEPSGGNERILAISLQTRAGKVHLISIYAPTLDADSEVKDQFYEDLSDVVSAIPAEEEMILLGDFNARVGRDNDAWSGILGPHGVGNLNENGQRLLEMCTFHNLSVMNTFFKTKPRHAVTWKHPRSGHWHQLDLVVARRDSRRKFLHTRSYHSADCNTDHALVCSRIRLTSLIRTSRVQHSSKRLDIARLSCEDTRQDLIDRLALDINQGSEALGVEEEWNYLKGHVYGTALSVLGTSKRVKNDWFEENLHIMQPVLEQKRQAFIKYKRDPSEANKLRLRAKQNLAKRTARECANRYWLELGDSIQCDSDRGNLKGMYDGIRKACGPVERKTAPIRAKDGAILTDKHDQMRRWEEHYMDLYSTGSQLNDHARENLPTVPLMTSLDNAPTIEEVSEAIESLSSGKASGQDGISAELIKSCKSALLSAIHSLIVRCWQEGRIPQDFKDAKIVTLYKNKGDRSDCNNHRGISLLSVVGKVFARVVLKKLQVLAEGVYSESQCGFRRDRSTIDMIFTLSLLKEKCREQRQPLFIAFIDLTKAFDLVSRQGLYYVLHKIGAPPKMLAIIQAFYDGMRGTVQFDGTMSDSFPIQNGVKQGCVLAPTLFGIYFAVLLSQAFENSSEGIYLHSRSDGKLFNIARLRAKTKIHRVLVRELLFADDAALVSHTESGLQDLVSSFSVACNDFGLKISLTKTEIMKQGNVSDPIISIGQHRLETVTSFTYLGRTVTSNLNLDTEMNKRIGKAAGVMSRLRSRVWENSKLEIKTKIAVYRACVLSVLLYGSECWTTYAMQERRLNSFHLRNLRRILGIRWYHRVTNNEVFDKAGISSINAFLTQRRLRWLGHVHRMDDGRLPKDILYGQLAVGTRAVGRPLLRFTDVCKRDMCRGGADAGTWEDIADDRSAWRQLVSETRDTVETRRRIEDEARRERRHQRNRLGAERQSLPERLHMCQICNRDCGSRIGLFSHTRSCQSTRRIFEDQAHSHTD